MFRRALTVTTVAVLSAVVPAIALAGTGTHTGRTLYMTVRDGRSSFTGPAIRGAAIPASVSDPTAVERFSGFRCQVTVGVGANGQTPRSRFTRNSVEFSFTYTQGSVTFESVSTTCAGRLPAATRVSPFIVSHPVACRQFDPTDASAPTIQGYGMATTYPDRMFTETCNTPNAS